MLKTMKENFQSHSQEYPISFSNFLVLMDMVKGQIDSISSITQLIQMMLKVSQKS